MKSNTLIIAGMITAAAIGAVATLQISGDGDAHLRQWAAINGLLSACNSHNGSWEDIKRAIDTCQVERGVQLHDLTVATALKGGRTLCAKEPKIDIILDAEQAARSQCGRVPIAIE